MNAPGAIASREQLQRAVDEARASLHKTEATIREAVATRKRAWATYDCACAALDAYDDTAAAR